MDLKEKELFTGQDFEDFTNWLNLKDFSQKWDGRIHQELEKFYLLFLGSTPSVFSFNTKRKLVLAIFNEPLKRWFDWFFSKLCIYFCVFKNIEVLKVLEQFELDASEFLEVIRQHLVELGIKPNIEMLSEEYLYQNPEVTFKDFCNSKDDIYLLKEECRKHSVYSSLDFTFYPEWKSCLIKLRSLSTQKKENIPKKKDKMYKNFFYEFSVIFISIALSLGLFKVGNNFYNNYLSSKIEIYEPSFFWLNKDLSFKAEDKQVRELNLSQDELEKLEIKESESIPFIDEKRETPESEVVVLTSGNIPKNLKYISEEKSRYEEIKKGGFRDKAYGRRKAYRIILNSVEVGNLKNKIKEITDRYKTKEFGKVALGQEIPGGSYFNLYVEEVELNEFLEEVVALDSSSRLFVSKTHSEEGPEGFEKVFIWIKSI